MLIEVNQKQEARKFNCRVNGTDAVILSTDDIPGTCIVMSVEEAERIAAAISAALIESDMAKGKFEPTHRECCPGCGSNACELRCEEHETVFRCIDCSFIWSKKY